MKKLNIFACVVVVIVLILRSINLIVDSEVLGLCTMILSLIAVIAMIVNCVRMKKTEGKDKKQGDGFAASQNTQER